MTHHNHPLLSVRGLSVGLSDVDGRSAHVLEDVDLTVAASESVGLVGESGSGKSVLARTVLGLHPRTTHITAQGGISFAGNELLGLTPRAHRQTLGTDVSMIFQDPSSSLNPVVRVGAQILEATHRRQSSAHQRRALLTGLLESVGLTDVERIARAYPSELSGGQRQRVGIAAALAGAPRLLMADEPTTALDVSVQRTILDLLDQLRHERSLAMIHVTHDLALLSGRSDRIIVLYAGRVMEDGPTPQVLTQPAHPYTRALMEMRPRLRRPQPLPLPQIRGDLPRLDQPRTGCPFAPRCALADTRCHSERPPTTPVPESTLGHVAACWRTVEAAALAVPLREPAGRSHP
ncbi:ABC transporter ATP-binding protein [Ornithinimicrobium murale]|uniref:ABC transporter ATP-binding protein n=1 Tax=Ornithinimicrobium murale TaxID=1050153 RepID=UPI0013B36CC7|nr:ABC transporter ATP-binding protein [Ornithinimicrobium murale]